MPVRTNESWRLATLPQFDSRGINPNGEPYSPQQLSDYATLFLLEHEDESAGLEPLQKRIVNFLEEVGEATVYEIAQRVGSPLQVTRELSILSELNRVQSRRREKGFEGKTLYSVVAHEDPVVWLTEEKIAYRKSAEIYSAREIDPSLSEGKMYGRSYPEGGRKTWRRKSAR